MQRSVVTIVAGSEGRLDEAVIAAAAESIRSLGVEGIEIDHLHRGRAVDIFMRANNAELTRQVYQKLQNIGPFDIFVQADDASRKKRLLLADMDATIIVGETLDELAGHLGLKDQIAPITASAMRGEIDFAEALRLRVGLLRGMPLSDLFRTIEEIRFSPGAETLVKVMNRQGAKCILISGGFDFFTRHVAARAGFYKNFGNRLGVEDDRLTGEVMPPIVDKLVKKKTLEEEAGRLGIPLAQTVAAGDGANDIPMLQTAGAGVGYFAKPAVVKATPYQIRHSDLTAILYMQGYREEMIY